MKNLNRKAEARRAAAGMESRADTLVIVESKHGSALKYGEWISNTLHTDMIPATRKYLGYASLYRNVIYIGWIKDGRIEKLNLLQQNYVNFNMAGKHIAVIGVGVGNPTDSYLKRIIAYNALDQFGDSFHYLPGAVDEKKRKAGDMNNIQHCLKNLGKLYEKEDAELIGERLVQGYDGISRNKIESIVDEITAVRNNTYRKDEPEEDGENE